MKKTCIIILFYFLISGSIAQNAKDSVMSFSLSQALEYTMQNSPVIKNANLDLEIAKKKIWETTTIGLPQVNSTLSYSYMITLSPTIEQFNSFGENFGQIYGMLGSLAYNTGNIPVLTKLDSISKANASSETVTENDMKWGLTYDITVSEIIFNGAYLVGLQTAKIYKEFSEISITKSNIDAVEEVSNAYYLVLIAQENKNILDTIYSNTEKLYTYIKSMNAEGLVEETDVDQMQLTLSTIKNTRDMITRQLEVVKNLLKYQMGIELSKTIVLTDNLNSLLETSDLAGLTLKDFKVENNVNYKLMETQEKLSGLNLKLQKSALLPDVVAFYSHQENFNDKSFSFTPPNLVGVSMNIPIFGSGMKIAKIQQAKIGLEKVRNLKQQVSLGLQTTFINAKSKYTTALNTYITKKQNVILAEKIYNKSLVKYQEGIIGSMELTVSQNQYLQAQSEYYTSIIELTTAKSELEKLLK
ncbi:MAG TPA: TolC family protein [Bacteroidales bacterium]|nr:TolC family protein [Bacteroidales bacterium]HPS18193.1 TolC family protein [Bacteroidales bacterium]